MGLGVWYDKVMWLGFAIGTAVFWGLSVAFVKRSYNSLSPVMAIMVGALVSVVIMLPFAFSNGGQLVIWPLVPVATIAAAGYALYYYALEKSKVSLVATVQSTYPLTTVVLASFFLHEVTSMGAKLAIGVILVGLILLSLDNPKDIMKVKVGSWLLWGLAVAVSAGVGDFLGKVMVMGFDAYTYMVAFVLGEVIFAVILGVIDRKRVTMLKTNMDSVYVILAAVFLYLGYILFYLAYEDGLASIVTPITGAYAVMTLFLAVTWLKEKISRYQLLGALVTIAGVVLVSTQ